LNVCTEVFVVVANNVSWSSVFTDEEITITARVNVATKFAGGLPDELSKVADTAAVSTGVLALLLVPSGDGGGGITVSLSEIFTVWAAGVYHVAASSVSGCSIVGELSAPLQSRGAVVGTELVVGCKAVSSDTAGWLFLLDWLRLGLLGDGSVVDWLVCWSLWLWRWSWSIGDWWWNINLSDNWGNICWGWLRAGGDIDGRGDSDVVDLDDLVTLNFGDTVFAFAWDRDGNDRGDQSGQWENVGTHFVLIFSGLGCQGID